jgi:hypothetical protein
MTKSQKVIGHNSNDVYAKYDTVYEDVAMEAGMQAAKEYHRKEDELRQEVQMADGRKVELKGEWNHLHSRTLEALKAQAKSETREARRAGEDLIIKSDTAEADKLVVVFEAVLDELGSLILVGHGYPIILLEYLHIVESVVEGALDRAKGRPDSVRLGVFFGTAYSVVQVLREYMTQHGEAVDSVELGRLRDVCATFDVIGERAKKCH